MANAIQGSGNKIGLQSLLDQAADLARTEGAGFKSRPDLAVLVVTAGADTTLSVSDPERKDEIKQVHATYVAACKGASDDAVSSEMTSIVNQIAKLRALVKLGALGGNAGHNYDGVSVVTRTRAIHAKGKRDLAYSTFDAMVFIARKQTSSEHIAAELTDEQIVALLTKGDNAEKDELQKAKSILGSLIKMRDGNENTGVPGYPSTEVMGAVQWMEALCDRLSLAAEKDKLLKLQARVDARLVGVSQAHHAASPSNEAALAAAATAGMQSNDDEADENEDEAEAA